MTKCTNIPRAPLDQESDKSVTTMTFTFCRFLKLNPILLVIFETKNKSIDYDKYEAQ